MKIVLVLPVYNEDKILSNSVNTLYRFMANNIKDDWQIIIANNGSTDNTKKIAQSLSRRLPKVTLIDLEVKGRGNALKQAWQNSHSDIYAYCDIDLATDISHIKELFEAVSRGNDIAVGSRYIGQANAKRTFLRLMLSKGYNFLAWVMFNTKIKDLQCGFKAVNLRVVDELLPKLRDNHWFFDTELLLKAEKQGYRVKEIPVNWKESNESKVKFFNTVSDYIFKLLKQKKRIK